MTFLTIPKLSALFSSGMLTPLLVTIVTILIVYLVVSFIGNQFDVQLGPIKIKFGGKKNKEQLKKDKKYLIDKVKGITKKIEHQIVELKYDTLSRQIKFTEEKSADIKSILSQIYSDLLKEKLPEEEKKNVKSHKEYRYYQMLLKIALYECVVLPLKKAFKINHINEITGIEWQKYINHKIDISISMLSEFFDIMYVNNLFVTREELSKGNDSKMSAFKEEMNEIINNSKEVQTKNDLKISNLEKELEDKINEMIDNGDKK